MLRTQRNVLSDNLDPAIGVTYDPASYEARRFDSF